MTENFLKQRNEKFVYMENMSPYDTKPQNYVARHARLLNENSHQIEPTKQY